MRRCHQLKKLAIKLRNLERSVLEVLSNVTLGKLFGDIPREAGRRRGGGKAISTQAPPGNPASLVTEECNLRYLFQVFYTLQKCLLLHLIFFLSKTTLANLNLHIYASIFYFFIHFALYDDIVAVRHGTGLHLRVLWQ